MPVSVANSQVYDALKACDVKIISALPETGWYTSSAWPTTTPMSR
jgi:hypothetical protein